MVDEPTVEATIAILRGLKTKYEAHHGVVIKDTALVAAANLSHRYITDRFLPDKAIDLVDEAASQLRLQQESRPEAVEILHRQIVIMKIEAESLRKETDISSKERLAKLRESIATKEKEFAELNGVWESEKRALDQVKQVKRDLDRAQVELRDVQRRGDLARASELMYGKIPELMRQLPDSESASTEGTKLLSDAVTEELIARVVAKATGVPVERMMTSERSKLLHLEDKLSESVVGQAAACKAIANCIRRSRAGLHKAKGPLGAFMFVGPTGVGKTQLAKSLAKFLFDTEKAIIRLDMLEYMERFSMSRLIGSPPGYVGYEEGGTLTEAVRRKPYSIVLFDEFEKAHPDVANNMLLSILDEGHIMDSRGNNIDFRNTVIVLTSNVGADILASLPPGEPSEAARPAVMERIRNTFSPEFLNRLDEVILFNRLSREEMEPILDLEMRDVQSMLAERKLDVKLTPDARTWLVEHGYDPIYGARPMRRLVQNALLNPLASYIIGSPEIAPKTTLSVELEKDELVVRKKD